MTRDDVHIDGARLLSRLRELGDVGRGPDGRLSRLAATPAERAARNVVVGWLRELEMEVEVDAVGNIFGTWGGGGGGAPVMTGSHVDTVEDAGIYDGAYGVLAGIEVVAALQRAGHLPARPVTVAAFTNEEGVRYTPDMMGSLVHAGALRPEAALSAVGTDGSVLGEELKAIGYAGSMEPGSIHPHAFIELHVEQGPVLEREAARIGAVDGVQGLCWKRITIEGQANHAGTTPLELRRDALLAAARVVLFARELAEASGGTTVATVGRLRVEPDVVNVVPRRAELTLDFRDADPARLDDVDARLADFLGRLGAETGVRISVEELARTRPVRFDAGLVARIEDAAGALGLECRRLTSGAGHDAQMLAPVAPSAMIFVPSVGGVSHSPHERTSDEDVVAGANVLLEVVRGLVGA